MALCDDEAVLSNSASQIGDLVGSEHAANSLLDKSNARCDDSTGATNLAIEPHLHVRRVSSERGLRPKSRFGVATQYDASSEPFPTEEAAFA